MEPPESRRLPVRLPFTALSTGHTGHPSAPVCGEGRHHPGGFHRQLIWTSPRAGSCVAVAERSFCPIHLARYVDSHMATAPHTATGRTARRKPGVAVEVPGHRCLPGRRACRPRHRAGIARHPSAVPPPRTAPTAPAYRSPSGHASRMSVSVAYPVHRDFTGPQRPHRAWRGGLTKVCHDFRLVWTCSVRVGQCRWTSVEVRGGLTGQPSPLGRNHLPWQHVV